MSGGWQNSDRRSRLPSNWPAITTAIHLRSGGICEVIKTSTGQRCTNPANGGVDHIDRDGGDGFENLRDTCHFHHSKKSSKEGNDAKAAKKALKKRPQEEHPGAIRRSPPRC